MDTVNGLDAQVAAMATDRANVAFLCLGVNDLNGGDMEALQAKVESNIVTVKSYGTKPIYIGPVKCWTDNTGAVEQDKALIRSAIIAGCAAQSCDHIVTYDCPDYLASETADGVHPLLAGAIKLEAHIRPQVEALL
jgi:lysophospholipase L1-like esterase